MAVDLARVVEVVQAGMLRDLGDEVEMIFLYGSFQTGAAHHYSDLDISYVPAQESTWRSITVLVDDRLCDFYPIHWSRLESMARFDDVSAPVLLHSRIIYQRSAETAARFQALGQQLRALAEPAARAQMLRKAQEIFQGTGYDLYRLRRQAAAGHLPSCRQHAQAILRAVLHGLAACNQRWVDTRKLAQVLALPKQPAGLAETVDRILWAREPAALLDAVEALLDATRDLLLAEQRLVQRDERSFAAIFEAGYPEFKGGLQHVLLACERRDLFTVHDVLSPLYHEIAFHLALASTGVEYSGFNSLAEYEQDLAALGFPDLLSPAAAGEFDVLHRRTLAFDARLRQFLTERAVSLNEFATVEELEAHLGV